jgi:nucleoside-diphosphate-sugar epimerase
MRKTMRVLVAGASSAIGSRLVPQLINEGHEVIGTHRSPGNSQHLRALGAHPFELDLLDAPAVRRAVLKAAPEAIVHQATALAEVSFARNLDRVFAQTNRLRREGTDALLAAARGRRTPDHRPELRQHAIRARGWAGEERGRPARSDCGANDARNERRDGPS